jgi:putative SOS response-associated peptidase YedK
MTARYALTSPIEALRAAFRFDGGVPYPPRYNIAPTQPVAIIRLRPGLEATGERDLALVRWGLLPSWVKDPATFAPLVNARAESLLDKPSYRGAIRHRRCLVPADGFYVWTGETGDKTPYLLRPVAPGPMALAGVAEHWLGADGSELETMAIVTVPAKGALRRLTERGPVLLEASARDAWLDVRGTSHEAAVRLLQAPIDGFLDPVAIGLAVNNPRNEGPDVQRPAAGAADR